MNKIYGLKWRADIGSFVVVPETARTVSVKRSPRIRPQRAGALADALAGLQQVQMVLKPLWAAMLTAGLSLAYAAPPLPTQLPTGGKVSAGAASISQAGTVMTVTQGSQRAAVNWQSFDIGAQGTVNFVQPSSSSVILNRVLGGAPSQIFGKVNANGQVILSNPAGILFSPSATLNVGALTATTHSLSDSNLMAGKLVFERNGSQASVVNEGQITSALGGYVALLAPEVRNSGIILAQMGTVAMASGEWIELQFDERSKLANLMVIPSAIQALVDNRQAVQAPGGLIILSAQAASRLQGGVVRNSGTLEAKGIVNDGGVIRITASDRIVHSGRISADAKTDATGQGGTVTLIADLSNPDSVTEVSGSISAQGGATGGRGGFVETSASRLDIGEGALVNTSAPQGEAGTWLLDPYNVTIAATGASGTAYSNNFTAGSDSVILASSIISALNAGSNVTIDTGAAGSAGASAGNISVTTDILRAADGWRPTLTLNAANKIDITGNIGTSGVVLNLVLNAGGGAGVFSGVFSGTGSLTKQGAGAVSLAGTNTHTGGTTISGGTLQIGNGGAGGALTGNITNNAALAFNRSDAFTYAGVISGSGTVAQIGAGTSTLSGNNTYSGTTSVSAGQLTLTGSNSGTGAITISGGTLQVGNAGATGTVAANITNNAALAFNLSSAYTYGGVIGGTGTLALNGAGTITLTGANTQTGSTTISTGTLQIGSGTSGSWAGPIVNNAALIFNRSDALSYSGIISGTGTLTSSGAGTIALSGNNSYSGTTLVSGGALILSGSNTGTGAVTVNATKQLKIGDGSATGDLAANITNSGTVVFNRTGALTYGGAISGSGALSQTGTGTVTLSGSNSYSGATTVSAGQLTLTGANTGAGVITLSGGTLQVGNGATSGSLSAGSITNNAALVFNRSDALSYSGAISGTGTLTQSGGGAVTLSGSNTYSGSTLVGAGTLILSGSNTGTGTVTVNTGTQLKIGDAGASGDLAANISNSGTVVFNRTGSYTYNGAISGTGTLSQSGTGTVTLSGSNSYSGTTSVSAGQLTLTGANTGAGAVTISGGTLQIGNGSTGSLVADITNNAALIISRSDTYTYGGAISGTGTLRVGNGASTTTLSGNNSYSGATTITGANLILSGANTGTGVITVNMGTQLKIGDGGAAGSVAANITDNGTVLFNRTDSYTYSGAISGTGALTQSGSGTTKLTGTNSYSGGTTISAGTLQIGDAGTSGALSGNITNNAALVFNRSDVTYVYGGVISGSGTVTQGGTGMITLAGNNTSTGAVSISAGTLQIGNGGTTGSVAGSIINNAGLLFNRSNAITYSGVISGTGTVRQYGLGTLTLAGNNTYTGITTIYSGTLNVGGGSTSGSLAGDIVNKAALEFSRSDALTYSGVISGTGNLTKSGSGTTTLSGNNTYSGTTTVSAGQLTLTGDNIGTGAITISGGTLQVGAGGATGSIAADITNNAALIFNRSDAYTYAGIVSGTGTLTNSGAGTVTLSGNNSYSGATTVSAGTLVLSGSNSGTGRITVNVGALLKVGGASGSVAAYITDNGALELNRSTAWTYAGVISGSGSLTQSGTGSITLAGDNTYSGATNVSAGQLTLAGNNTGTGVVTISGGTLQVGSGATSGSLSAASITNNGALVLSRSDAGASYAGIISGTGTVTHSGTGTTTLSGNNTYSGATTVSGGTLILSGSNSGTGTITVNTGALLKVGGTSGSVAANITDNGALEFNRSTDWTYSGVISGSGSLTQSGAGTTTLSGSNNYTGATTISAGQLTLSGDNTGTGVVTISGGKLQLGAGGTSGSVSAASITNNAVLVFNRSDASLSYAGIISGAGSLTQSGTGTTTLSGNNTYSGATTVSAGQLTLSGNNTGTGAVTISAGTLQVGTGGTSGSVSAATIANSGSLVFSRSDALLTYAGVISGTGSLTKSGTGTVVLSGNNGYSGTTTISAGQLTLTGAKTGTGAITISAGTLQVGAGGASGQVASDITNNGALVFSRSDALYTYAGTISGTGTVTNSGTGTVTLSGNNSYSGSTTVSAGQLTLSGSNTGTGVITISGGTLQVGAGGTTGSISTTSITNNAALTFNRSDAYTYAGIISGTGSLTKSGIGTLTLSGNSSYSGDTTISGGTLQVGDAGTSGSLSGNIVNNAALVFSRSDALSYIGIISGTGTLSNNGAGTVTLSGNNSYSGATTVSAGTLVLSGSNSGTGRITVNLGALLKVGGASGSVAANITDNGALELNRSTAWTYAGVIGGSGAVTQSGTGNITLSGANIYTGTTTVSAGQLTLAENNSGTGAVTISGGTLQVGNGGTSGWVSAASITNNGALVFNRSDVGLSYGGTISGTGTVTQSGTGTTTLSGNNSYSGATTVSAGQLKLTGANTGTGALTISGATLQVGAGGTSGSILAASITNNGALVFSRSDAYTYASAISGTGTLTQSGAGTITLSGNNTYSGTTTISAGQLTLSGNNTGTGAVTISGGRLQVGAGGTTGSVSAGSITNNAALVFSRSDTYAYAGVISGTGTLTQSGTGTTTLSGNNTYSGATTVSAGQLTLSGNNTGVGDVTISAGTLQVGSGGTSGSVSAATIANSGALVFSRSDAYTYAGIISGTGTLTKSGAGTLTLSGNNSHSGTTTISAGTLQIGDAGTTGSLSGNIVNNSALVFSRSDVFNYAGVISGTGTVTKNGLGTTTLLGDNTYSGTTSVSAGQLTLSGNNSGTGAVTISGGTLQVGAGGTSGSLAAASITNNAALVFLRADALSYSGAISGTGTLTQSGAGTTTLSGNNSYSGTTSVSFGQLMLSGNNTGTGVISITGGTLQVGAGGTTGTIAANVTNNAALVFNRSDAALTYGGVISGTGTLSSSGAGTATLSGNNSYSGATTVNSGTLVLSGSNSGTGRITVNLGALLKIGGASGAIAADIVDNGTVELNRSTAWTYAGVIGGTGAVTQSGTGNITLSAISTYSGATNVSAGQLTLAGNNTGTGAVTISGGTLQVGAGGTTGALSATSVTNNGALVFNRSDAYSYVGSISGTGTLNQTGTGATTLSANNTYSGATTVSAGVLILSGNNSGTGTITVNAGALLKVGGASGSVTANITDNGAVEFNRSTDWTYASVISGSGTLTHSGAGTTSLTGANTLTGGTTISAGTLQLGAGAASGSLAGNVLTSATLAFNRSDSVVFGGLISGAGRVSQVGLGTTKLTGTNTYTGGTSINAGTLQIGDGGTSGAITGNVTNNAALVFNRSASSLAYTLDGVISGTGSVTQAGLGTTKLTGDSTYTGGTTISAGTLQIGDGGASGKITGNISNNAALVFNRAAASLAYILSGVISGSGSVTQSGAGTTILTGDNTYTGGTTLSAGALQVGAGGPSATTGALVGNITNNAALVFSRADTLSYAGVISGTGTVAQTGVGTIILTGNSTSTGTITISAGTLQLGNGGTSGALVGNIANAASLVLSRSDNWTYSGVISGGGSLSQQGTGATTLAGNNTRFGQTTVSAGQLVLTGSNDSAGRVTVSGGTLKIGGGGATGSLSAAISNDSSVVFDLTNTYTYSNLISGYGSLTKAGSGTVKLTGSNTYTGGTTVSAGTLQLGDGGTSGAITGNIVNNAALVFNRSDTFAVVSGVISGSGSVMQSGTGSTTLTADNTYTGGTTISAGTLQIGNDGAVSAVNPGMTGSVLGNIVNNSALVFSRSNTLTYDGVISGSGTLAQSGAGTTILTGANTLSGGTSITNGALQLGAGAAAGSLRGNITIGSGKALIFNRSDAVTLDGVISGGGGLTLSGAGTLTLTGNNTYLGATAINSGTLLISGTGSLGALSAGIYSYSAGISLGAGATLNYGSSTTTRQKLTGAISGGGRLVKSGSSTLEVTSYGGNLGHGGGTTVEGGTLQLSGGYDGNVTNNAQLILSGGTLNGVVSGTGAVVFYGTTILNSAQTYTGGTTISGGFTMTLNAPGALPASTDLTVDTGSTLIVRTNATFRSLAGGGTVNYPGVLGDTVTLTVGGGMGSADNSTFSGSITKSSLNGTFIFRKDGPGTQILTGNNSFGGAVHILQGTLQVGNGGTTGTIPALKSTPVGGEDTANTDNINCGVRISCVIVNNGLLAINRSDDVDFSGAMSGTGGLLKAGAGNLNLKSASWARPVSLSSYTGGTTITGGTLTIAATGALGVGGPLTITGGTLATTRYDWFNDWIGQSAGNRSYDVDASTVTITGGFVTGLGAIRASGGFFITTNTNMTIAGNLSGTGGLTKAGTGTLTLSGFNSYSGNTLVSAGILKAGNIAFGQGTVTVSDGAAVDINGYALENNFVLSGNGVASSGALFNSSTGKAMLYGSLTLSADTTIKTLGDLTIDSSVESVAAGYYALSIVNTGKVEITRDIGRPGSRWQDTTRLGRLEVTGNVAIGGNIKTDGGIRFGGSVELYADNLRLSSEYGDIFAAQGFVSALQSTRVVQFIGGDQYIYNGTTYTIGAVGAPLTGSLYATPVAGSFDSHSNIWTPGFTSYSWRAPVTTTAQLLVVAGGGAGGWHDMIKDIGGGGGGGVGFVPFASLTSGSTYTIQVGNGGSSSRLASPPTGAAEPFAGVFGRGADSSFYGPSASNATQLLITYGGGPGGYNSTDNGLLGGSGGGGHFGFFGSGGRPKAGFVTGLTGYTLLGSEGGRSASGNGWAGGGGGGARSNGGVGREDGTGGNGGEGYLSAITGSPVVYGSGGAGNGIKGAGTPGTNGGAVVPFTPTDQTNANLSLLTIKLANPSTPTSLADAYITAAGYALQSGRPNTGGGGAAGDSNKAYTSDLGQAFTNYGTAGQFTGAGGSGVVILRFKQPVDGTANVIVDPGTGHYDAPPPGHGGRTITPIVLPTTDPTPVYVRMVGTTSNSNIYGTAPSYAPVLYTTAAATTEAPFPRPPIVTGAGGVVTTATRPSVAPRPAGGVDAASPPEEAVPGGLTASTPVGSLNIAYASGLSTTSQYTLSPAVSTPWAVTLRPLTITAVADTKVYDRSITSSATPTLSGAGLASGDSISSLLQSYADWNAGTGKTLSVNSGYDIKNASNVSVLSNYTITLTSNTSGVINRADLPVTGLSASNKRYDATATAPLGGTATVNPILGDSVTLGGTAAGSFANANVGTDKPVTVTGLTISGNDAGNYNLIQQTGLRANITPGSLTVTGLSANNKVYDGLLGATLSGTAVLNGLASADTASTVYLSGSAAGSFADKNVGTGKPVTVTGLTLSGSAADNYTLLQPSGLSANITKASLTISGITASNKVYDGGTTAVVSTTAAIKTGLVDGDTLTVSATGSFADKNVGSGKTVTLSSSYGGTDAGNYTITGQASTTADISKANLTVTGLTANNKVYDATPTATLSGTPGVTAIGTDKVTLGGTAAGSFADKNVGTAKPVTVTGLTVGGDDAGNYNLIQQTGLSADITRANLAVTGLTANNKVYDGTATATLSGTAGVTPLSTDTVTLGGTAAASFADKNVGTAKPVTVSGFTISGTEAGNYALVQPSGLSAEITKASLTLSGTRAYDGGTAYAGTKLSAAGVNGESFAVAGAGDASNLSSKNVQTGSTLASVTGLSLGAGNSAAAIASNYSALSTAGSSVDVTKASLSLSGTRAYDGSTTYAGAKLSAAGVNGESFAVTGAGDASNLSSKNVQTGSTLASVTGLALGAGNSAAALASNYSALSTAGSSVDVTAASLTLSGTRAYNGGTAYAGSNLSAAGVSGESFAVTGAGDASNLSSKNVQTGSTLASVTGLALGAGNSAAALASNYNALSTAGSSVDVTKASLSLSGTRAYDGSTTYAGAKLSAAGVNGESFAVTGAGDASNLSSKNVQTGSTLASVTGLALGAGNSAAALASNYSALSTAGSSVDVTAASLTLSGTRAYNGGTAYAGSNLSAAGVSGESFAVTGAGDASNLSSKNVQTGSTLASVTGLSLGAGNSAAAIASNYSALSTAGSSVDVTKASLSLSGTRAYDGSTTYAGAKLSAAGVNGESFAVTGAGDASNLSSKNVQTGSTLASVTGLALGAGNSAAALASNYSALSTAGSSVDVTAASLTLSGTRVYNGGTDYAGAKLSAAGVNGESFAVTGFGDASNLSSKNVQTGSALASVTGLALGAGNSAAALASNYRALSTVGSSVDVTAATLTITGASTSLTYNAAERTNSYSVAGAQGGEEASIRSAITGSAKRVDVGTSADDLRPAASAAVLSNYSVSYVNNGLTITQKAATVVGNVSTKVYNGQSQTSGYTVTGVEAADSAAVSVAGAASATHVAEGVKNDNFSVSGSKAGNYSFTYTPGSVQITPKALTVDGQSTSVSYDRTDKTNAAATVTGLALAADLLGISGYGAGRNAGTYSDNLSVSLANASDYAVTVSNGRLSINPATITLSGITANNKDYDGTTTATLSTGSVSTTGVYSGDTVSVNVGTLSASFADKNAGTNKSVSISGISLTGADAANYQLSGGTTASTTANIDKKALSITGAATARTYDAQTQTNAAATVSGLVSGESVTVTGLAQGRNAGVYNDALAAMADTGTNLSNYAVSYSHGSLTINKAALTITADTKDKFYGKADPTLTATDSGLKGTDTLASIGLSSGVTLSRAAGENATIVAGVDTPLAITAAGPASTTNYNITYVAGNFTIVPADVLRVRMDTTTTTYGTAGVHGALSVSYLPSSSATGDQVNMTGSNGGLTWTDGISTINLAPALASVSGVNGLLTPVGSYSRAVTATASGSTGNFTDVFVNAGTLKVDPAALTINIANDRRTYNATAYAGNASLASARSGDLKNGETLAGLGGVTLGGAAIGSVNAGSYAITGSAGAGFSNYTVTVNPGTLTTDKAALTLAGKNTVTTYNATAQTNKAPTITGWQGSDESSGTVAVTGLATGTRAGSYSDSFALTGERSGNYEISGGSTPGTLRIDKATLTVKGADNRNVYTGALQTNTGASISGLQGSDTASVSGYAQATHVAQGTVSDSLSLTLSNPGDYQVNATQGSLSITPATVSVSGRNTTSTYTALAQTNTYTTSGLVGTDALTVTGMASATDVRRDGAGRVMAYADSLRVTLPSSDYQLGTVTDGSLTLNPAPLTLAGQKTSLTYNASAQVNGAPTVLGLLGADTAAGAVTVSGLGAGTRAGTYADSYALSGSRSGNYEISRDSTTGELLIKPKDLTVKGADNRNVYTGALQTNTGASISGLQGSDTASVSGYAQATHVAQGTVSDSLSLTLSNPGDYQVSTTQGSLSITPATVSVSGRNTTSTYTALAQTNTYTTSGLVGTDALTVTGMASATDVRRDGAGRVIAYADSLRVTLPSSDYQLGTVTDGSLTLNPAPLTLAGQNTIVPYNASPQVNRAPSIAGLLGADTAAGAVSVTGLGAGTRAGTYADSYALSGPRSSNYAISVSSRAGQLVINSVTPPPAPPSGGGGDEAAKGPLILPETAASAAAVASRAAPIISVLVVRQSSTEIGGIVVVYVPKELATSGQGFSFTIPDTLFNAPTEVTATDTKASGPARATLVNGDPLPRWLSFDPQTKVISASAVPDRGFPVEVVITEGRKVVTVVVSERASGT